MRRISLFIVINAISLYIVSVLMKSVYIGSLASLITLTIIFGLLNLIVKEDFLINNLESGFKDVLIQFLH